jgi:hypothetical protein
MICTHNCPNWRNCPIDVVSPGKECKLAEPVTYYYCSQASPGKWKKCEDEAHCKQMANIGYKVKKVVRE